MIKIKDREPKKGQKVLAYRPFASEYGDEEFAILEFTGIKSIDHKGNIFKFDRIHYVSHWEELIKPN